MTTVFSVTELIKQNKNKIRVNEKMFRKYMEQAEKETGFDKWTKNRLIQMTETRSYQDFEIYDIFGIRFTDHNQKFLGFVHHMGAIFELINKTEELPLFMVQFEAFIEKLEQDLNLFWNDNELQKLNKIRWFVEFYSKLQQISEGVLYSFKKNCFYLKDSGIHIKFDVAPNKDYVGIEVYKNTITFKMNNYNENSLNELDKKIEEANIISSLRSKSLSQMFKEQKVEKGLYISVFSDMLNFGFSNSIERVMKYIEKAVPGPLFDVLYTTCPRSTLISGPYMNFSIEYYKCDFGYYMVDMIEKCVIFKETREEMFNHCIGKIVSADAIIKYH